MYQVAEQKATLLTKRGNLWIAFKEHSVNQNHVIQTIEVVAFFVFILTIIWNMLLVF